MNREKKHKESRIPFVPKGDGKEEKKVHLQPQQYTASDTHISLAKPHVRKE